MPPSAPAPVAHDPYAALRIPHYRDYLLGSSFALIGRQAVTAAAIWQVYEWTHSATALGLGGVSIATAIALMSITGLVVATPGGMLGDRIGKLIGAAPGTVVLGDTLSIKVYQALASALEMNPKRRVILSDTGNFPSDLYMAEGLCRTLGGQYRLKTVAPEEVMAAIDDTVAVTMITEVDYRTGRRHDMADITKRGKVRIGVLIGAHQRLNVEAGWRHLPHDVGQQRETGHDSPCRRETAARRRPSRGSRAWAEPGPTTRRGR